MASNEEEEEGRRLNWMRRERERRLEAPKLGQKMTRWTES